MHKVRPTALLALSALLCTLSPGRADSTPKKPLVFAAYYIWYSTGEAAKPWSHWTYDAVKKRHGDSNPLAQPGDPPLASSAYPLAGLYSSQNQALAEWHMNLAKAAGVDAFLVSWWGRNNETDVAFEKATLPAAEKSGFKVALLDELAQFHNDDAVYMAGLAAALKKYKDSPAYLKIDGRPAVYLYQVAAKPGLSPASFAKVREYVEREVGPVYWIVDKLAHNHKAAKPEETKHIPPEWLKVEGIDSFAFYSTFSHFRAHRYDELVGPFRSLVNSAHRAGKKMMLPVHPGHDNSRFSVQPYEMPRRDGETFRDFLRAATDAGADFILVTSWNEWPETTIIEPSRTWADPNQYLKILAQWKGVDFQQLLLSAALAGQKNIEFPISNGTMKLAVSTRDAGAVCSLVYGGKELVNDRDHGRQMQVAWCYNDLDEAYNPTEAGADADGTGPTSTSRLLSLEASQRRIFTRSLPAYWRHTRLPEAHRKNTALLTNDVLEKTITLGYGGDDHVIVFDTKIDLSAQLTGPPLESLRIEAPTLYANADLNQHYTLDLLSGALTAVPSRATGKDRMNERIVRVERPTLIPVLCSEDKRHAVAFFTPPSKDFWAYYTWDVPSDDAANACQKVTAFFKHPAQAGASYRYRTFVIVGDLQTVQQSARGLLASLK